MQTPSLSISPSPQVVLVTQSNACMSYLGRRLGLFGKNTAEQTKCDELLCELMDIRNRMVGFAYPASSPPAAAADAAAVLEAAAGRTSSFQKLENHLAVKVHPRHSLYRYLYFFSIYLSIYPSIPPSLFPTRVLVPTSVLTLTPPISRHDP